MPRFYTCGLGTSSIQFPGFLISSPEYNSSITPLLKNTIDWASRPVKGEPPLACFDGKVALLVSASPGALGGMRGLVTVRSILGNIGTHVLPGTISISQAADAVSDRAFQSQLIEIRRKRADRRAIQDQIDAGE